MHRMLIVGRIAGQIEYHEKENGQKTVIFDLLSHEEQSRRVYNMKFRCIAYDRRAQMIYENIQPNDVIGIIGRIRVPERGIVGQPLVAPDGSYSFIYQVLVDNVELRVLPDENTLEPIAFDESTTT